MERGVCANTKATSGCGRGMDGGEQRGRRGGQSSQTYHDTPDLALLHICIGPSNVLMKMIAVEEQG